MKSRKDNVTYNDPPHRFEAGTPPIVQAVGLGAALDYMREVGRAKIHAHETALGQYAQERMSQLNSVRIFGRARARARFSLSISRAHTRTMSRRSSIAKAWQFAPVRIAPSRCWRGSA